MRALVPYAVGDPKTRLAPLLTADERRSFSRAMLADVLDSITTAEAEPTVIVTEPIDLPAETIVDERPLTQAVNHELAAEPGPTAIVMADLPLVTPATLQRLFATAGDVVLAPGRGAGTNAIVSRNPAFTVDYHGGSFLKHLRTVDDLGLDVEIIDSHRLATDIDEPNDLVELLVHGEGTAVQWLHDHDIALDTDHSRLSVIRTD